MVFLLAASLSAQEALTGGREGTVFFERVEVTVVNVDVYVTDQQGNRVTDLTVDDFEILEDGRPMAITNFYTVVRGRRLPPEPAIAGTDKPTAEPAAGGRIRRGHLPIPADQRLYLVLYFDNLFLRPFNRNKVVREVRSFLRTELRPDDQVMLVTFDKSLHIRHPFTSNRTAISEALFGIEKLTGFGVQAASERRKVLERLENSDSFSEAEAYVDFLAKSIYNDMTDSIQALREVVGSLAGLPGRKAILYVSDGIPMTAAEDLFFLLGQQHQRGVSGELLASKYRASRQFRELTAQANANRVTFYPLEAAGLRSHASLSAEHGRSDSSYIEADFMYLMSRQAPLQVMAADTGGLAAFNTNNIAGALQDMGGDLGSYYSLGYTPAHAGGGRYHKIEVRVKRKGLDVRHRTGYRDKTAETRVTEGTLAALLYGAEANPLGIQLVVERGRARDDEYYLVPIMVRIPLSKVTLIPGADQHRGELRVSVAVIDEEGRMSTPDHTPIPISIPDSELEVARQQYFVYSVELLMRPGRHIVAVGLRDDFAQENVFVREPVRVGL